MQAFKDIAATLAPFAWPLVVLALAWRFKSQLDMILRRDSVNLKVGGFELTVRDATEVIGKQVADIQQQIASLEKRLPSRPDTTAAVPPAVAADETGAEMNRPRGHGQKAILWLDDNPANNIFDIEKLRRSGIRVDISLTTDDALKLSRRQTYDAIITDLHRSENGTDNDLAGVDFVEAFRKIDRQTPVAVYTGRYARLRRDDLLRQGATAAFSSVTELYGFLLDVGVVTEP
jgi:hypothetical protein